MKDKILTIDVGTGSTRAAIVRIDGAMIGFAQREYEQTTPRAGWSEQAPSLWWQAACDCIREVLYRYPETAAQIAVIGACGQMHGTVLLDDPQLLQEAAAVPAGAEGLLFLPYLTGERLAEHTNSRAQFFGLQRKHRRGHLFRAVLEGVAFASWRNLRQLQKCGQYPQQMIASGGGARSSLWLEIKAAAYNLPILSTRNQENGVTGCGIIAGVGAGLYADFASGVRQTVQFDKVISPDPRLRDYYHACSELFDTLYRQSAALYDRLDALSVGRD